MIAPTGGRISQRFSLAHQALDIVDAPKGQAATSHRAPIAAPEAGVVTHAGQMGSGVANAGLVVQIGDPKGNAHRLCHLDSASVKVGQKVTEGQEVGRMGHSGFTIPSGLGGTHLHWIMFRAGKRVDPSKYVTIPATGSTVKPPAPVFKMPPVGARIQLIPKDVRTTFKAGTTTKAGAIRVTDNTYIYVVRGYDKKFPGRILINSASAGGNGVALALYYATGARIPGWKQL